LVTDAGVSGTPVIDRGRTLITALMTAVEGDVMYWFDFESGSPGKITLFADAGWSGSKDKQAILGLHEHPEVGQSLNILATHPACLTRTDEQLTSSLARSEQQQWYRHTQSAGLSHLMFNAYPLPQQRRSCVAIHRRVHRPPYSSRDRGLVHLTLLLVDALHRKIRDIPPGIDRITELPPRQKQVLMHLLAGDSKKQIAHKLLLSEHTIGDHLKEIYKYFKVNTRSDLLGLFMNGGLTHLSSSN
jgi:DNA-binding CsgD family transcriptional regulator